MWPGFEKTCGQQERVVEARKQKPRSMLAERLWAKVDVRGPDECWLRTGAANPKGYGVIYDGRSRSPRRAHRIMWELTNGPIPDGMLVCQPAVL